MKPYFVFLLVVALGNVAYHLGQKTLPPDANPMVLLMGVYLLAFLMSAAAIPLFNGGGGVTVARLWASKPVLILAVGVFLIELGFLIAYRQGAPLQWSGAAVNGVAALFLIPVAIYGFREAISMAQGAGIVLVVAGLALLTRH